MLSTLLPRTLSATDLHVWYASLIGSLEELSNFFTLLLPDEKARAGRFYFERDRNRYIFGRGILRSLLGDYLGMEPSKIIFNYGPHGKPAVESKSLDQALQFNLAHSNDRAIYIFSRSCPVGIDLEHIHPLQDADSFSEQFYSARETALIHSLPDDRKWDVFYKFWTCKEAFLKANGSGLTVPLNLVEIFLGNDDTARLISIGGDMEQAAKWKLKIFKPFPGFQAAIAVQGEVGKVQFNT